jgi:flagellar hook-associated protein 1 FlgK
MGLLDSLNIGRKALSAASAGITVVSNNVANVSTPGYSRRNLSTSTSSPLEQQGVWFGQGVDVNSIVRSHDRYLGMRLIDAVGQQARSNSTEESLKLTEAYFNETETTGLVEVYGSFYSALTQLTSDPSDLSLRTAAVHAADTLAVTVARTANGLNNTIGSFDDSFGAIFSVLNSAFQEIASLNDAIGSKGDITGSADLLDKRDQLIRDIAGYTGASVELSADGQATVYIGGHAVVSGGEARDLSLVTTAGAAPTVFLAADGGTIDITSSLGGTMGGLVDARAYTEGYLNQLDDFAFTFATSINAIHAAGFDAYGNPGLDVFVPPGAVAGAAAAMAIDPVLFSDPNLLALAGFAGAGSGEDTNLRALLDFEDNTAFTGTVTGLQFLSGLVSDVGSDMNAVAADADAQDALVEDFDEMRASISGVDTDEEAIRLIEYQAAYRAASQLISATDEMLRILTQLGAS